MKANTKRKKNEWNIYCDLININYSLYFVYFFKLFIYIVNCHLVNLCYLYNNRESEKSLVIFLLKLREVL